MIRQAEFRMITDLSTAVPQSLDFNFAELNAWTDEVLTEYRGIVVDREQMSDFKAMRAKLNKLKKAVSDQRIAIKKAYMEPCTAFEKQVKVIEGKIDECSKALDEQIKAIEHDNLENKMAELRAYFDEHATGLQEYITFERLLNDNPKWKNITYAKSDIFAEIDKAIDDCKKSLADEAERIEVSFKIVATKAQLADLKQWFKDNHIKPTRL